MKRRIIFLRYKFLIFSEVVNILKKSSKMKLKKVVVHFGVFYRENIFRFLRHILNF